LSLVRPDHPGGTRIARTLTALAATEKEGRTWLPYWAVSRRLTVVAALRALPDVLAVAFSRSN
jgi:hypothetical protein